MEPTLTEEGFPLRVIAIQYLGPMGEHTERSIGFFFNDGVQIFLNKTGIEGLMSSPLVAKYEPLVSNLVFNEQEHWFADKPPMLATQLFV